MKGVREAVLLAVLRLVLLVVSCVAHAECLNSSATGEKICAELNADVSQETLVQTVCTPGYTATVRPAQSFTNGIKLKLLRERGEPPENASLYQLDHLIPLALGGHPRALSNLWLQPLKGDGGARSKDKLERKMHCLVCTGKLSLLEARTMMATDWKQARQTLGHTKCNRTFGSSD